MWAELSSIVNTVNEKFEKVKTVALDLEREVDEALGLRKKDSKEASGGSEEGTGVIEKPPAPPEPPQEPPLEPPPEPPASGAALTPAEKRQARLAAAKAEAARLQAEAERLAREAHDEAAGAEAEEPAQPTLPEPSRPEPTPPTPAPEPSVLLSSRLSLELTPSAREVLRRAVPRFPVTGDVPEDVWEEVVGLATPALSLSGPERAARRAALDRVAALREEVERLEARQVAQDGKIRALSARQAKAEEALAAAQEETAALTAKREAMARARAEAQAGSELLAARRGRAAEELAAARAEVERLVMDCERLAQHVQDASPLDPGAPDLEARVRDRLQRVKAHSSEQLDRARAELQHALRRQERAAEEQEAALARRVRAARAALDEESARVGAAEEEHLARMGAARQRLRSAEASGEDSSVSVSEATHPMLRVVAGHEEALRLHLEASRAEEAKVRSEIQVLEAAAAARREAGQRTLAALAAAKSDLNVVRARRAVLDARVTSLRSEISDREAATAALNAKAAALTADLARVQASRAAAAAQAQADEQQDAQALAQAKQKEEAAARELETAKSELDAVHAKLAQPPPPPTQPQQPPASSSSSSTVAPGVGHAANVAGLQRELRQKRSRLAALREDHDHLSKQVTSLSAQLPILKTKSLQFDQKELQRLEAEASKVLREHHITLEMVGEAEETIEELQADINDLKDAIQSLQK